MVILDACFGQLFICFFGRRVRAGSIFLPHVGVPELSGLFQVRERLLMHLSSFRAQSFKVGEPL